MNRPVWAMLATIALRKGSRNHAKFLIDYTDDELQETEFRDFDWDC